MPDTVFGHITRVRCHVCPQVLVGLAWIVVTVFIVIVTAAERVTSWVLGKSYQEYRPDALVDELSVPPTHELVEAWSAGPQPRRR
ncbi:MAG: hypothetical protein FWE61_07915 [Micrococcales bacterium]|nr:hypothetical protein [Micrococcales bacterium]